MVNMYDRLTRKDVEKMQKEVDERKLVVRKQALEDVKEARHCLNIKWVTEFILRLTIVTDIML